MKKSFLILLSSILAVFLITGCADDTTSNNNGGNTTPPTDPALVEQIKQFAEGYYEVSFFYTDGASHLPLTSSCTKATEQGLNTGESCTDVPTKGYAQITVDNNGGINLATKIQMTNGTLALLSKDSQYNYTVYPTIPATAVDMSQIATTGTVTINKNNVVKGTSGRDLSKNVSDAAATYSFDVTIPADTTTTPITIKNTMVTTTPIAIGNPTTNVIVEMTKIDALPSGYTMDKNAQFPKPVINDFVTNPQ